MVVLLLSYGTSKEWSYLCIHPCLLGCDAPAHVQSAATAPGTVPGSKHDYAARRSALRRMWIQDARRHTNTVIKFVAGRSSDPVAQADLEAEAKQHGDIMVLPLQVGRS